MSDEKLLSIFDNLAEIIGREEIIEKIQTGKILKIYWGTAPTKPCSLAYFIGLLKLRDCLRAGFQVNILLADIHSYLDKGSSTIPHTDARTEYYEFLLKNMLKRIGVNPEEINFVRGSDFQLDRKYTLDLLKFSTILSVNAAKKASSEVVKQNKNTTLVSSLLYPMMQVLDETFFDASIQLGGCDQRKIFMLSRDYKEQLGYKKCAYFMNPLLPSLSNPKEKMSSSNPKGKIELYDSKEKIMSKISSAFCEEKLDDLGMSPLLQMSRLIVFPILGKLGKYENYDNFLSDWKEGNISAKEFKEILSVAVEDIVEPIREEILKNREFFEKAFGELKI